jgi:hypothetical protein
LAAREHVQDRPGTGSSEQRECARQEWCTDYRIIPGADGAQRRPALTYQAFCQPDTALIATYLSPDAGLPAAYRRLAADIGNPARRREMVRVPFGPRMPLSEYYDLLMRRTAEVLGSYEERVRTAANLVPADTRRSSLRALWSGEAAVAGSAQILSAHLSALLALPAGPVIRHIPAAEVKAATDPRRAMPLAPWWQGAVVCSSAYGTAAILAMMDGAGAGIEILDLHRRCLAALGEIAANPELLDGIPCRSCGVMGLERAEPPADPETEADYSRCPDPACGDRMKLATYRAWVKRYEAWARSLEPLTCQRCANGDCGECIYPGCQCATEGHLRDVA